MFHLSVCLKFISSRLLWSTNLPELYRRTHRARDGRQHDAYTLNRIDIASNFSAEMATPVIKASVDAAF